MALSNNFVKGDKDSLMNVWLDVRLVELRSAGVGKDFTREDFVDWDFDGDDKYEDWHWLGNGKWPILKWQLDN